jgi:V-type H+-transporting ATPase subunit C
MSLLTISHSFRKIAEDEEYGLYTVTLFRRIAEDFTNKCREER